MTIDNNIQSETRELVESILMRPVEPDTALLETGLVDSVLAVEIVLGVEMKFNVRIPPTEIAEHLSSVQTLAAFIAAER